MGMRQTDRQRKKDIKKEKDFEKEKDIKKEKDFEILRRAPSESNFHNIIFEDDFLYCDQVYKGFFLTEMEI